MPVITLLYAGILGIMSIILSFGAGSQRVSKDISVGDGGDAELLVAIRRHGNFVEYVPLALLLIALHEMTGTSAMTLHVFGAVLVLSRIAHAVGLRSDVVKVPLRGIGAGGTALLTVVMSVWGIARFF